LEIRKRGSIEPMSTIVTFTEASREIDQINVLVIESNIGKLDAKRTYELSGLIRCVDRIECIPAQFYRNPGLFQALTNCSIIWQLMGLNMASRRKPALQPLVPMQENPLFPDDEDGDCPIPFNHEWTGLTLKAGQCLRAAWLQV
jgi:hypothetical protein